MSPGKSRFPIVIFRQAGIKTLAILFFISLASFIFVAEPQAAAPSVTQHGVGWFSADGTHNTALTPVSPPEDLKGTDEIGFEQQLYTLINQTRAAGKLPPLLRVDPLKKSARDHSQAMDKTDRFDTVDSKGNSPLDRANQAGYKQPALVLEVIAAGYQTPGEVINALLGNPSTQANLLSSAVNEVGIGYHFSRDDAIYHHYWTVDLGHRSGLAYTVVVNNGAESTASPQVNLYIGGTGWATRMQVSNAANFSGAGWEPYTEYKAWTLSGDKGKKKIYVKLQGADGTTIQLTGQIALMGAKGGPPAPLIDDALTLDLGLGGKTPAPAPTTAPTPTQSTIPFTATPTNTPAPAPTPTGSAPGFYQTSSYMLDRVAIGIILPQCNGAIDACTESWSSSRMDLVYNQIVDAMNWWNARVNGQATFVFEQQRQIPTGYEPIRHPQSDEGLWIGDAMTQLGYTGASYGDQVFAYDNALRQKYGTDWAYTLFIVDSNNNTTGTFTDGLFAYAYLQGPFAVMTYDNDGYSINNMNAVFAHESGHIFGALDEYPGANVPCTQTSGYLGVQNQNSVQSGCLVNVGSIMRGGIDPYTNRQVDGYALGMMGYRISGTDGLPDPIDTTPSVAFGPMASSVSNTTLTITGSAQDQPYLPPSGTALTINYITNVQYRVDGGAWQNAAPSDGNPTFNQVSEGFTFSVSLNPGTHTLDVQATNRVNHTSSIASIPITIVNPTPTPSRTPSPTPSSTPSPTPLPTNTRVPTFTPTNTPTFTPTPSRTNTPTSTRTPTATRTPTRTPTPSRTPTPTSTTVNPPSNLTARVNAGNIQLSWNASTTAGVTYRVYRGTSTSSAALLASGLTTLAYKDATTVKGTVYTYYVTAYRNDGVESAGSNKVTATAK